MVHDVFKINLPTFHRKEIRRGFVDSCFDIVFRHRTGLLSWEPSSYNPVVL